MDNIKTFEEVDKIEKKIEESNVIINETKKLYLLGDNNLT